MSSAALAKKRRAAQPQVPSLPTPSQTPSTQSQNNRVPVSIPQMFSLMEKRINTLEKEIKMKSVQSNTVAEEDSKKIFEEYDSRFDLFAIEINTIKDVLLNLQTYTINVNKVLLEQNGTVKVPDLSEQTLLTPIGEVAVEEPNDNSAV